MKYLLVLIMLVIAIGCDNPTTSTISTEIIQYTGSSGDTLTLTGSSFVWTKCPLSFFKNKTIRGSWHNAQPMQYPDIDYSDTMPGPKYDAIMFTTDTCDNFYFKFPYSTDGPYLYSPIGTDGTQWLIYLLKE